MSCVGICRWVTITWKSGTTLFWRNSVYFQRDWGSWPAVFILPNHTWEFYSQPSPPTHAAFSHKHRRSSLNPLDRSCSFNLVMFIHMFQRNGGPHWLTNWSQDIKANRREGVCLIGCGVPSVQQQWPLWGVTGFHSYFQFLMKRHEGIHIPVPCPALPSASYPDATGSLSVATSGEKAWGTNVSDELCQKKNNNNGASSVHPWVKMTLQPTPPPFGNLLMMMMKFIWMGQEGQQRNISPVGHENAWCQDVLLLDRKRPKEHVFVQQRSWPQRGWGRVGWWAISSTNFSVFLCQFEH